MFGFAFVVLPSLISLVSSAYVAPRSERYNITPYAPSPPSPKTYAFLNATSIQQCQVAITSWLTTTLTITSSSADVSSGSASSATTLYASNNRRLAMKGSAISTTAPTSTGPSARSTSPSTTTINTISLLSEFASIYSALSQYEYNATANSSTVTGTSSFNISAYSTATGTVYSNSSGANATSIPTVCASPCTACTTVFYIATTTITTTTTAPPSPITTLPPITIGTNTYTATGTYYVIDNSTLSPGGFAILVSNSTLLSLGPSGTQLVIAPLSPTAGGPGPSTYDLSPSPAASPQQTTPASTSISTSAISKAAKAEIALTTITGPYNLPVVVSPSQAIVIAGTTITPGSSAVTIRETPVSLAPSSAFLVVGSSTISLVMTTALAMASSTPLSTSTSTSIFTPAPATTAQVGVGSMIWSGLGGTESTSTATRTATTAATTTTSNAATITNNNATYIGQVFTGTGIEARRKAGALLWTGFGLAVSITVGGVLL